MKLKEYSDKVKETAIYPKSVGKIYAILGMADEMGEVSEKLDFESSIGSISDEIGDTLWYLTATIREFELHDLFDYFDSSLNQKVYNLENHPKYLGNMGMRVGLNLVGRVKKVIRDESMQFTPQKVSEIERLVVSYIDIIILMVAKMRLNMDDIMDKNIQKLFSRKQRGVLSGDGDNR